MSEGDSKAIREIGISEFRRKCFALLKRVSKTKSTLRVTRRGKPLADVVPPAAPPPAGRDWLGSMSGKIKITGDIISPIIGSREHDSR